MKKDSLGIAAGGEFRLRKAIEAQVRKECANELATTTDPCRKAALAAKIEREIKERMKRVASPQSLWSAR